MSVTPILMAASDLDLCRSCGEHPEVACAHCGEKFSPPQWRINQGRARFCSQSCARSARKIVPEKHLMAHVDRSGGVDACWPWTGTMGPLGYGQWGRRRVLAHRAMWEYTNSQALPSSVFVLHSCNNRACCNPKHLRPGTHQDNMADRQKSQRQARGTMLPFAKLTPDVVRNIRRLFHEGHSQADIGRIFGVSKTTVQHVVNERTWRHVN